VANLAVAAVLDRNILQRGNGYTWCNRVASWMSLKTGREDTRA
jgi:hypothetical protein